MEDTELLLGLRLPRRLEDWGETEEVGLGARASLLPLNGGAPSLAKDVLLRLLRRKAAGGASVALAAVIAERRLPPLPSLPEQKDLVLLLVSLSIFFL